MYAITVMSIKKLCSLIDRINPRRTALLAVSSYDFDMEILSKIDRKLLLHFEDTIIKNDPDAFNAEIAERIKNFVDGLVDDIDILYVCCDGGQSRSSAMAAAIKRYKKLDEWDIWCSTTYHPNSLVYYVLCKAFLKCVSKLGVKYRVKRNEKTLKSEIKKQKKRK